MSKATDNMTLRAAKENEMLYVFRQSQQIKMQTGYVGYLRGDFGKTEMSSILLGTMKSVKEKHLNFSLNLMMS